MKKMEESIKCKEYALSEVRVEFVRLYETPTSYAEVKREWMEHE